MPSSPSSSPSSASETAAAVPGLESAISVRGLTVRFGNRAVLENLDLEVRRGEVLGVVGGSGTGKSVLLRTIVGLQRAAAGRIVTLGVEHSDLDPAEHGDFESRFGVLFQDGALFSSLSVAQNIQLPLREHRDLPEDLICDLTRLKLAMVGLPMDAATKHPSELSGGMRKRAGLARALALDPELLFLDEPTAGLDPIAAADFDQLIRDLQRSMRLTVFMVTHDLDSLAAICDRIAALVERRLVVGTLDELMRNPHPWLRAYFAG